MSLKTGSFLVRWFIGALAGVAVAACGGEEPEVQSRVQAVYGPEICTDGIDNDEDGPQDCSDSDCMNAPPCCATQNWIADSDNDGYGNPAMTTSACWQPAGYVSSWVMYDCNDTNPTINSGAWEMCNGLDDDCDGQTDEGLMMTYWVDADNDGYQTQNAATLVTCSPPGPGYTMNQNPGYDCNDTVASVNPSMTETCNNADDNCNGTIDEGLTMTYWVDADNDGYQTQNAATLVTCSPPGPGYTMNQNPGYDCNDASGTVHPSATETCNNVDDNCNGTVDEGLMMTYWVDADNDGYQTQNAATLVTCSPPGPGYTMNQNPGYDCNDTVASVNPSMTETCNNADDNCNGTVDEGMTMTYYRDADNDGHGVVAGSIQACGPQPGYTMMLGDCDDNRNDAHPYAPEVCNGLDDNCDNNVDEGLIMTYRVDADNDGYPTMNAATLVTCTPPGPGYTMNQNPGYDCDDTLASVNPSMMETCNGVDDNCNGTVDDALLMTYYRDADGDGFTVSANSIQACAPTPGYRLDPPSDCDDGNAAIYPMATEWCNGLDDNCNGTADDSLMMTYYIDADGDGHAVDGNGILDCESPGQGYTTTPMGYSDCDDTVASVNPMATEMCNEVDDDCDGTVDDGLTATYHVDGDGDGYGDETDTVVACTAPPGFTMMGGDCDDLRPEAHPGATETCGGNYDDDCDGDSRCDDYDCAATLECTYEVCTTCEPPEDPPDPVELCADGIDNDGDGLVDCHDTVDCRSHPHCRMCGNRQVDPGEECDDGYSCIDGPNIGKECWPSRPEDDCGAGFAAACQEVNGDGCNIDCKLECGDGHVQTMPNIGISRPYHPNSVLGTYYYETCDDGPSCASGARCDRSVPGSCADGSACVPRDGDGCNAICQQECSATPACGDWTDHDGNGHLTESDLCIPLCDDECTWRGFNYMFWASRFTVPGSGGWGTHTGIGIFGIQVKYDKRVGTTGTDAPHLGGSGYLSWPRYRNGRDGVSMASGGGTNPYLCNTGPGSWGEGPCYEMPSLGKWKEATDIIMTGIQQEALEDYYFCDANARVVNPIYNYARTLTDTSEDPDGEYRKLLSAHPINVAPSVWHSQTSQEQGAQPWRLRMDRCNGSAKAVQGTFGIPDGYCASQCGNCSYAIPGDASAGAIWDDWGDWSDQNAAIIPAPADCQSVGYYGGTGMTSTANGLVASNPMTHCARHGCATTSDESLASGTNPWPIANGITFATPVIYGGYGHNSNTCAETEKQHFEACFAQGGDIDQTDVNGFCSVCGPVGETPGRQEPCAPGVIYADVPIPVNGWNTAKSEWAGSASAKLYGDPICMKTVGYTWSHAPIQVECRRNADPPPQPVKCAWGGFNVTVGNFINWQPVGGLPGQNPEACDPDHDGRLDCDIDY